MKGKVFRLALVALLTMGAFSVARADTLLFPVLAVNPGNVTTIVSVINNASPSSTHLTYTYRYKDTFVSGLPNITGACSAVSVTRNTYVGDLVSFDASGSLNGGNALFGDSDTYGGGFALPGTGPRRAYLLVTHSNAGGVPQTVTGGLPSVLPAISLAGEAIVMDIVGGAAWGYKAINDTTRQNYTFDSAGVQTALNGSLYRNFSFFPPNEWTTRFFVTPIGADMDSANLEATVRLSTLVHVFNRTGFEFSFTPPDVVPKCTAAVDLSALMDSTTFSNVGATGGFSRFVVSSSTSAVAYKLEYVFENPTYGGTNNNAYLITTTTDTP